MALVGQLKCPWWHFLDSELAQNPQIRSKSSKKRAFRPWNPAGIFLTFKESLRPLLHILVCSTVRGHIPRLDRGEGWSGRVGPLVVRRPKCRSSNSHISYTTFNRKQRPNLTHVHVQFVCTPNVPLCRTKAGGCDSSEKRSCGNKSGRQKKVFPCSPEGGFLPLTWHVAAKSVLVQLVLQAPLCVCIQAVMKHSCRSSIKLPSWLLCFMRRACVGSVAEDSKVSRRNVHIHTYVVMFLGEAEDRRWFLCSLEAKTEPEFFKLAIYIADEGVIVCHFRRKVIKKSSFWGNLSSFQVLVTEGISHSDICKLLLLRNPLKGTFLELSQG